MSSNTKLQKCFNSYPKFNSLLSKLNTKSGTRKCFKECPKLDGKRQNPVEMKSSNSITGNKKTRAISFPGKLEYHSFDFPLQLPSFTYYTKAKVSVEIQNKSCFWNFRDFMNIAITWSIVLAFRGTSIEYGLYKLRCNINKMFKIYFSLENRMAILL